MNVGHHTEVLDSPTVTFLRLESHITRLNPGESTTPRNRDPGDELFVVKSGLVEATLNGIAHRAGAGFLFYVAPNDERTMRNVGQGPCSYQVIRSSRKICRRRPDWSSVKEWAGPRHGARRPPARDPALSLFVEREPSASPQ